MGCLNGDNKHIKIKRHRDGTVDWTILQIDYFVNADTIAAGLSAFAPEKAAIQAGKAMLQRIHNLADARENFAFETT